MKEKYQSKYLSEEKPKKSKRTMGWVTALIAVALIVVVALLLPGFLERPERVTEPSQTVSQQMLNGEVHTAFGVLKIDEEYADAIYHKEVVENDVTVEVFSMRVEEKERELFRIYFGDATAGDTLGKVTVNGQKVPVSVVPSTYGEEEFSDEEDMHSYYALMEQVNAIIDSLYDSDNFTAIGAQSYVDEPQVAADLTYWSVDLPKSITWEEKHTDEGYYVDFYGTIGGEQVLLYTISLTETPDGDVIGTYEIEGKMMNVSVKPYTMQSQSSLNMEEYGSEYDFMMETINDVLQAIKSEERFSQ